MLETLHRKSIFSSVESRMYSDWSETIKSLHKEKAEVKKDETAIQKRIDFVRGNIAKYGKTIRNMETAIKGKTPDELREAFNTAREEYQNAWKIVFGEPLDGAEDDWNDIVTILRGYKDTMDKASEIASYPQKIMDFKAIVPNPKVLELLEGRLKAERHRIAPVIESIDNDLDFARESNKYCSRTINLSSMRTAGATMRQLQDNKW